LEVHVPLETDLDASRPCRHCPARLVFNRRSAATPRQWAVSRREAILGHEAAVSCLPRELAPNGARMITSDDTPEGASAQSAVDRTLVACTT
jgi:hypothetical protein